MMDDIFRGLGVEIILKEEDDFLKVRETLSRVGVTSSHSKKLFQSCHILHKRGRYAILHFKELFILDGRQSNIDEEDIARRNTIVNLLEEWNLLEIIDRESVRSPVIAMNKLKIIPFKQKNDWELITKYTIGSR